MESTAHARLWQIAEHLRTPSHAHCEAVRGSACSAAESKGKVVTAEEAVALIPDGATLTVCWLF